MHLFEQTVVELGFANAKGLVADTTAQEAAIPYPTEVGLMGSFKRNLLAGINTLGKWVREYAKKSVIKICKAIQSSVHKYDLFGKTREMKDKSSHMLLKQSKKLKSIVSEIYNHLKNHKPCPHKILSLFIPEARAIPRGKEGKTCEFGFKWLINRIRKGYLTVFANPNWGHIGDVDCAVKAVEEPTPNYFPYLILII